MTVGPAVHAKPHYVYRAYSINGVLLYVGCTSSIRVRMRDHLRGLSWIQLTHLITLEEFPNRYSGRQAELSAIRHEFPIFNVVANKNMHADPDAIRYETHVHAEEAAA